MGTHPSQSREDFTRTSQKETLSKALGTWKTRIVSLCSDGHFLLVVLLLPLSLLTHPGTIILRRDLGDGAEKRGSGLSGS